MSAQASELPRITWGLGTGWAFVLVLLVITYQAGGCDDRGMLFFLPAWTLTWPPISLGMFIAASVAGTGAARRVLLAACVTLAAGIGLAAATTLTFMANGLGFWPPPDREFMDRFHEHESEFLELRDALLADVRPFDVEVQPASVRDQDLYHGGWLLPTPPGARGVLDRLGVRSAYADPGGRWLCFVLWDGQIHVNPLDHKGLLFVRSPSCRESVVADVVETIGDGWYVFER